MAASRIIPPDDGRTKPQNEIDADAEAVKNWLKENKPVKIDADGRWMRGDEFLGQFDVPAQNHYSPFDKWGSK